MPKQICFFTTNVGIPNVGGIWAQGSTVPVEEVDKHRTGLAEELRLRGACTIVNDSEPVPEPASDPGTAQQPNPFAIPPAQQVQPQPLRKVSPLAWEGAPEAMDVRGEQVATFIVVGCTISELGVTAEEWNALTDEERKEHVELFVSTDREPQTPGEGLQRPEGEDAPEIGKLYTREELEALPYDKFREVAEDVLGPNAPVQRPRATESILAAQEAKPGVGQ